MKKVILSLILFLMIGTVYADTNGIWQRAEDIREGIFGSDENATFFQFIDPVEFNINNGNGIYVFSQNGNAITGITNNSNAYSGYFEGGELRVESGNLIVNNGNVGIGILNPNYNLDVNGSINANSIYINGSKIATQSWVDEAISNSSSFSGSVEINSTYVVDLYDKTISLSGLTVCGKNRACSYHTAKIYTLKTYNNLEEFLGDNLEVDFKYVTEWTTDSSRVIKYQGIAELYDSNGNLINSYKTAITIGNRGTTKYDSLEIPKSDIVSVGKTGKLLIKGDFDFTSKYVQGTMTPSLVYKPIIGMIVN